MKKWIWIAVAAVAVLGVVWVYRTYNRFVRMDEEVKNAWAQVETQYQRRSDLIPNLVNTVKGYAAHERETLEGVIEARAKATSVNLSVDELTPATMAEFQQAQEGVRSALGRLLVVAERYPDLKANQNFQELQAQLEGTENRIAVARERFNTTVRAYNVSVRRFPAVIIAGMFGFDQKPYFQADEKAQQAPVVEF
ncbi:LemA family protein [uncultured Alistipes sp.]|jgi:LemA protein|uniref:LemA family protein n=1 Tax=uncultured Alistipes sp. TaxID=538949 RepID=UPI00272B6B41|nr:LemA family protein [uncultured Alistipes sp.]